MRRRLRMGMIGGGPGAFIGPVHRIAAELDRRIELVAGVFSSQAVRSKEAAGRYFIQPARAYPDLETMFSAETRRDDGIDFVSVVSPNHHHFLACRSALEAGLPVMSDKPLTATLQEAEALVRLSQARSLPLAVSYTYSGYALPREARAMIASGELGEIRKIVVQYPQGWLAAPDEDATLWRLDPEKAGAGGCIGDIGVHAFHLAEFVSGLRVESLLADLGAVVPGRVLDDDCSILLRFEGGVRGVLLASQVEIGQLNGLNFRISGEKGSLAWHQEKPNQLVYYTIGGDTRHIRAGDPGLSPAVSALCRTPGGHPEGYLEAFANLYRDWADMLQGANSPDLPMAEDGLRGMQFIDAAVSSNNAGNVWMPIRSVLPEMM